MRRLFIIVCLLLVLPLQLVWAAAAPYCAHEVTESASRHPGHHAHQHAAADMSSAADEVAADSAGAYHADCESCHLGAGMALPALTSSVQTAVRESVHAADPPRYLSHIPATLERPDIARPHSAVRFAGSVVEPGRPLLA